MTTMNISLPADMKAFVDQQVRKNGFMTSSEYIRDLIRDQKEIADLRAMLDASTPVPIGAFDAAFFSRMRAKIHQKRCP